jgi:flagellar biosynthesis protein FliQ
MNEQVAVDLVRQALLAAMWISLPMLCVLFAIGIVISLVQTLTSIQDPSFGSVPRLGALLLAILFSLPWMLGRLVTYTEDLIRNLSRYAN